MRAFWELVIRFFSNVLALILVGLQGSPLKVLRFSSSRAIMYAAMHGILYAIPTDKKSVNYESAASLTERPEWPIVAWDLYPVIT
jgi:hypothetical protein